MEGTYSTQYAECWALRSSSPWRTETGPLAAGGLATLPQWACSGLSRTQYKEEPNSAVRRNDSQSLSISCPRTGG